MENLEQIVEDSSVVMQSPVYVNSIVLMILELDEVFYLLRRDLSNEKEDELEEISLYTKNEIEDLFYNYINDCNANAFKLFRDVKELLR